MSDLASLERRLSDVERTVGELRQQIGNRPPVPGWLHRLRGAFDDRPEFEEVVRLGQEFREQNSSRDPSGPAS